MSHQPLQKSSKVLPELFWPQVRGHLTSEWGNLQESRQGASSVLAPVLCHSHGCSCSSPEAGTPLPQAQSPPPALSSSVSQAQGCPSALPGHAHGHRLHSLVESGATGLYFPRYGHRSKGRQRGSAGRSAAHSWGTRGRCPCQGPRCALGQVRALTRCRNSVLSFFLLRHRAAATLFFSRRLFLLSSSSSSCNKTETQVRASRCGQGSR